jgi:hypothetical protein
MISTRFGRPTAVLFWMTLTACGGGSDGPAAPAATAPAPAASSASAPAPTEPLASFLLNGKGGIGTLTIGIDASGAFTEAGTRYQLQANGPTGCAMTSDPVDQSVALCNPLLDGKSFLLCEDILSPHFGATLFRQSDVHVVKHWELAGQTLTGLSCGASGPRKTSYTFTFSNDGEMATERAGPVTNNYGAGVPEMITQPSGLPATGDWRQRWVIYKATSGTATQYFLLVLWQIDPSLPPRPVNLYFLQM